MLGSVHYLRDWVRENLNSAAESYVPPPLHETNNPSLSPTKVTTPSMVTTHLPLFARKSYIPPSPSEQHKSYSPPSFFPPPHVNNKHFLAIHH